MHFGAFEDKPHPIIVLYKNSGGMFYGGSTSWREVLALGGQDPNSLLCHGKDMAGNTILGFCFNFSAYVRINLSDQNLSKGILEDATWVFMVSKHRVSATWKFYHINP